MTSSTVGRATPGPWKASETSPAGDWCIHAPACPWQLAYVASNPNIEWPLEANARLIAAAPDLLSACQEFVRKVDAGEAKSTKSYAQMKTAIAKATGAA